MKPGSNPKRYRGNRPGNRGYRHGISSNYESSGPDVKVKGSAAQVHDRYQALSRDALASGDRVAAESYLQHAEHYQRIINAHLAAQAAQAEANGARPPRDGAERGPRPPAHEDEPERRPRPRRPRPASERPPAGEEKAAASESVAAEPATV